MARVSMDHLVSLVEVVASTRKAAVGSSPVEYETKRRLMEIPAYRDAHTSIGSRLREDERFASLEGSLALHQMWERFDPTSTAHWLASRASGVGAGQACSDLERFLGAKPFPYTVRVALSGVFTDHDVQFGQGLWLRHSPREHLPEALQPHGFLRSLMHLPTAALVEHRLQAIRRKTEADEKGPFIKVELEADDILLCLSLVRVSAMPFLVGIACEPAQWVPLSGYLNFPRTLESGGRQTRLWKEHTELAHDTYQRFRAFSAKTKDRLRLPMRRLNTSMRRRDDADAAIDLGIALEALFLGTAAESDKRYQAAIRCAFLLGRDAETRHRAYRLAGELYHLRNRAIHRGALHPDDLTKGFGDRPVRQVLQEGGQLVAEALRYFIASGGEEPNWDALVLGQKAEQDGSA